MEISRGIALPDAVGHFGEWRKKRPLEKKLQQRFGERFVNSLSIWPCCWPCDGGGAVLVLPTC